jgi:hypothetical protein
VIKRRLHLILAILLVVSIVASIIAASMSFFHSDEDASRNRDFTVIGDVYANNYYHWNGTDYVLVNSTITNRGTQCPQGEQGINGTNGSDGTNGINGTNGLDAIQQIEPYSFVVGVCPNGTYYARNCKEDTISFVSTNASYVFNSAITSMGTKTGEIYVTAGEYNLTNSILAKGGLHLQGEGINKYANQNGTKLQLSGSSFPLIIVNETDNQYFFSISDMELFGNGFSLYSINKGIVPNNCSAGIMLTGHSSDYLIENMFIHGFGVCVYADSASWYGRITKCWLEASGIGLYFDHKQMILSDSNISGCTYGIYASSGATDLLASNTHIYKISNSGFYIDKRIGTGASGFNFNNIDFTDNVESGIMAYVYSGQINITVVGCNFGFQDAATQKRGIAVWTAGTSQITTQVVASRFYAVTTGKLVDLEGSTKNRIWILSSNTGFVTENTFSGSNTTATTTVLNHGLEATPTFVVASFNDSAITGYTWSSSPTQVSITPIGTLPASWTCYVYAIYKP